MRLILLLSIAMTTTAWSAAPGMGPGGLPLSSLPIVARIKVPVGPGWLETGFGSLWVTKIDSRLILRIDPATDRVVARIPVGSHPEVGIGIGLRSVWIPDTKDHTITQIDPGTNQVVRTIPVDIADDTEGSIAVGEGSLWVLTNEGGTDSGTLTRIDAASGRIAANIAVRPHSHAALLAFHSVWVTGTASGTLSRIDPGSNSVIAEIAVHGSPRFLKASADAVWVLCQQDGTVNRVDPTSNRALEAIAVGIPGAGGDLSVDEGFVWVSGAGVPLSQIDPHDDHLIRQFVGGEKNDTMRAGFGAAWILDEPHGQIWKVDMKKLGTLPRRHGPASR
jgi:virginiamycin B lyase